MTEPKILRVRQVRACELRLSADSAAHRRGDVYELDEQIAQLLIEQGVVVIEADVATKASGKKGKAS
jgi:hypothetical protein